MAHDEPEQLETLFEFPCQFPIKVMGQHDADLTEIVLDALKQFGVTNIVDEVKERQSSDGKYKSITVMFEASSKKQLDAIYQLLTAHPAVKIVL